MPDQELAEPFTRYAISLPFDYRLAAETAYRLRGGWVRDLSARGAWVELPEVLAASADLQLRFEAPGAELRLAARVAWTCPDPHERPRLHGLLFTRVTPEQRTRLRALLAQRKTRGVGRLYCAFAATCRNKAAGDVPFPCETRDLSFGGVALRLPEPVPRGTQLRVTFPTTFGTVTADAQVVWAEPSDARPRGAPYRHGLRFLCIDSSSELPLKLLLAGWR